MISFLYCTVCVKKRLSHRRRTPAGEEKSFTFLKKYITKRGHIKEKKQNLAVFFLFHRESGQTFAGVTLCIS